jgi:Leucine-rich repeat (LRR) protein
MEQKALNDSAVEKACSPIFVGDAALESVDKASNGTWAVLWNNATVEGIQQTVLGEDASIITLGKNQFIPRGIFKTQSNNFISMNNVSHFDKNGNKMWTTQIDGKSCGFTQQDNDIYAFGSFLSGSGMRGGPILTHIISHIDEHGKVIWERILDSTHNRTWLDIMRHISFLDDKPNLYTFHEGKSGIGICSISISENTATYVSPNKDNFRESDSEQHIIYAQIRKGDTNRPALLLRPVNSNFSIPWEWSYNLMDNEKFSDSDDFLNGEYEITKRNELFLAGFVRSLKTAPKPYNGVEQLIYFLIDQNGQTVWKHSIDMGGLIRVNKVAALPSGELMIMCSVRAMYDRNNENNSKSCLLWLDANGDEIKRQVFNERPDWIFNGFEIIPDGGMYLYGKASSADLLVRTDDNATLPDKIKYIGVCDYSDSCKRELLSDTRNGNFHLHPEFSYDSHIYLTEINDNKKEQKSTSFDFKYRAIDTLDGIELFLNLKILNLSGNYIQDISPLNKLSEIEELDLSSNLISDIRPLAGLKKLRKLNLGNNHIEDITPLAQLTSLEELCLYQNKITDFSILKGFTNLRKLDLAYNSISDDSIFPGMQNLETLFLQRCGLTGIEALKDLNNLKYLDISSNNIQHVSSLKHLGNLKKLWANNNPLDDIHALAAASSWRPWNVSFQSNMTEFSFSDQDKELFRSRHVRVDP